MPLAQTHRQQVCPLDGIRFYPTSSDSQQLPRKFLFPLSFQIDRLGPQKQLCAALLWCGGSHGVLLQCLLPWARVWRGARPKARTSAEAESTFVSRESELTGAPWRTPAAPRSRTRRSSLCWSWSGGAEATRKRRQAPPSRCKAFLTHLSRLAAFGALFAGPLWAGRCADAGPQPVVDSEHLECLLRACCVLRRASRRQNMVEQSCFAPTRPASGACSRPTSGLGRADRLAISPSQGIFAAAVGLSASLHATRATFSNLGHALEMPVQPDERLISGLVPPRTASIGITCIIGKIGVAV